MFKLFLVTDVLASIFKPKADYLVLVY